MGVEAASWVQSWDLRVSQESARGQAQGRRQPMQSWLFRTRCPVWTGGSCQERKGGPEVAGPGSRRWPWVSCQELGCGVVVPKRASGKGSVVVGPAESDTSQHGGSNCCCPHAPACMDQEALSLSQCSLLVGHTLLPSDFRLLSSPLTVSCACAVWV